MTTFFVRIFANSLYLFAIIITGSFLIAGCGKTATEAGAPFRGVMEGVIIDATSGAPIDQAVITFSGGQKVVMTDANGTFEVDSLPIGANGFTITKSNYITVLDTVFIVTDRITDYSRAITPKLKGWITGWQPVSSGTTQILTNACYASPTTVFACGFSGTLLKSTDGGTSWGSVLIPTSENLYVVHFSSTSNGILMGNNGTILRTSDGGVSWVSGSSNTYAFRNASFADAQHGMAVGGDGNLGPAVFVTIDGGRSWTDLSSGISSASGGSSQSLYGVANPSPLVAYVGAASGQIFKTTDGGTTWSQPLTGAGWIRSISFTSTSTGAFVGANGKIEQSTDGGFSWATQAAGVSGFLNGITNSDVRHATAVGASGSIVHTRNGGSVWLNQSLSTTSQFYGSAFADSIHGVIVGENGSILTPIIQ